MVTVVEEAMVVVNQDMGTKVVDVVVKGVGSGGYSEGGNCGGGNCGDGGDHNDFGSSSGQKQSNYEPTKRGQLWWKKLRQTLGWWL